jgi:hypothetical protein
VGARVKTLVIGDCAAENIFDLVDPDAPLESDVEALAVRALSCLFPKHQCVVFTGSFLHEDRIARPDLALIAADFSHWFVIEVELVSHSLHGHVLPQMRALRYGEPQSDCLTILQRELSIGHAQVKTLVRQVPRTTAVISNRYEDEWRLSLSGIPVQYLSIGRLTTSSGHEAIQIDGTLEAVDRNLGFGTYAALDRSLRFPLDAQLPDGFIQIRDVGGSPSVWKVRRDKHATWITKEVGTPALSNGVFVQLILNHSGQISMRIPA